MESQLPLFGHRDMQPKAKLPISRAMIEQARQMYNSGDIKGSIEALRDIRYKLEAYCARINSK